MTRARHAPLLVTLVATLACSAGSPSAPSTPATLNVMLKDTPFADAKAVFVTFSEVSVASDDTFATIPFPASTRTCDLKQLATAQELLGTGVLTPGHYNQVRLVVASATLYFDNAWSGPACGATLGVPAGRSAPVTIPSGTVRLNQDFDISPSRATTILLDFDGGLSLHLTGNGTYMMRPVVTVVSVQ